MKTDSWTIPPTIAPNNFVYKSLSNWSLNFAVGCSHACRFCYVPDTISGMAPKLEKDFGVSDPDADWGDYVFLRKLDEKKFCQSLANAERRKELKADGNRAVILCSTTDAYQALRQPWLDELRATRRYCLEQILNRSTINVRILTRSPLAREDFDLMKAFGHRLLFGMSLPTLRNDIAKIYEPKAPAPSQRLETLRAAKAAGLNVFVAVAPTYPECDGNDLLNTLMAVRDLDPVTVFHEPINIRAENVARIEKHAADLGVTVKTEVFKTPETWRRYAFSQLRTVEGLAKKIGLTQLHLWPDQSLGYGVSVKQFKDEPIPLLPWLNKWWSRVSEWPKAPRAKPALQDRIIEIG